MAAIKYIDENAKLIDSPLDWQKAGLQQTATGYGLKLTTRYKVPHNGRLYRVYATCVSNCASHWIMAGGEKLHLSECQPKE